MRSPDRQRPAGLIHPQQDNFMASPISSKLHQSNANNPFQEESKNTTMGQIQQQTVDHRPRLESQQLLSATNFSDVLAAGGAMNREEIATNREDDAENMASKLDELEALA